jgi:hypothetical protein
MTGVGRPLACQNENAASPRERNPDELGAVHELRKQSGHPRMTFQPSGLRKGSISPMT